MNYPDLIAAIRDTHHQAQAGAAGAVNRHLILRNWLIGAYLVEFEQKGEDRAKYGAGLLKRVAADLAVRSISGCAVRMLERMRAFYHEYPQLVLLISSPAVTKSDTASVPRPLPPQMLLRLSWTHLIELLGIADPWKRAFYENECLKGNWSKRQLQRQIGSLLYERTGLSTDKHAVIEHARQQALDTPQHIADLIRDPYVLEFTGLAEKPH